MKICLIGKFPPIEGGVSRDTFWMAYALIAAGHEVHVVTNANHVEPSYRIGGVSDDATAAEQLIAADLSDGHYAIHRIHDFKRARYIPYAAPFVSSLTGRAIEVIREHSVDLIIAYYLEPYAVAAHLAAKMTGVPFGLRHAGSDIGQLMQHSDLQPLYIEILRSADFVFASSRTYRRLRHLGVSADRLYSPPPTVLHEKYFNSTVVPSKLEKKSSATCDDGHQSSPVLDKSDRPIIGLYGKIGETKGTFDLLRSTRRLLDHGLSFDLALMIKGSASQEQELCRLADDYRLWEYIHRVPFKNHWQVPGFIRACTAVCFLERDFPISIHQPMVPLEILACGGALILSHEIAQKMGFSSYLCHAKNVFLVDPRTETLDNALKAVVERPQVAETIGASGAALYSTHAFAFSEYIARLSEMIDSISRDSAARRQEMSMAELQHALARLYTDRTFLKLFELNSTEALAEFDLSEVEVETLRAIDLKALRLYAATLKTKVRGQYEDSFKVPLLVMGETAWRRFFDRYYSLYPARPGESMNVRLIQCAMFLEQYIEQHKSVAGEKPFLLDLIRFDRVKRQMVLQQSDNDNISLINYKAAPIIPLRPSTAIRLSRHARVERFRFDVEAALRYVENSSFEAPVERDSFYLYIVQPDRALPEIFPINKGLYDVLDFAKECERTIEEIAHLVADGASNEAKAEILDVTTLLASRGALIIRDDSLRS